MASSFAFSTADQLPLFSTEILPSWQDNFLNPPGLDQRQWKAEVDVSSWVQSFIGVFLLYFVNVLGAREMCLSLSAVYLAPLGDPSGAQYPKEKSKPQALIFS